MVGADQVQLYKLIARQVAAQSDLTASFLPKPVAGVNGNGMHTNMSVSRKRQEPLLGREGQGPPLRLGLGASSSRILANANDLCLILNPSVNAYRRLDPHFEAPNQIKVSASDRGSMVRIPFGNERSARIEVRSIAPDVNPYMAIYALFRTGLEGPPRGGRGRRKAARTRFLPDNIYDALRLFKASKCAQELLGDDVPREVLRAETGRRGALPQGPGHAHQAQRDQFHHEVTNQYLWGQF